MSVFKVPDMTCGHCEKIIRNALTKFSPDIKVDVNLKEKTISVENLSDEEVSFLLSEIGHSLEKIK
jgi:copper chaperone